MSGELLPCPFCGGAAVINDEPRTTKIQIMCSRDCECAIGTDWREPDDARAVWNTRMTTQQDSVDVERLRAIVSTILFRSSLIGTATQVEQTTAEIVAALSLPITQRDEQGDQWQDIASAPRDGTWFLGYWPACTFEDRIIATQWHDFGMGEAYWLDAADARDWTQPTHWMPAPQPPAIRRLSIEQGDQDRG